jgi:quinol monooxygenase YgiN/quercetin dioxygenase-like cupin family protein
MDGTLSLVVRLRVKPDAREAFLAAVRENAAASIREPGCLRFDVLQDTDDPDRFAFYELYRDAAAFEDHRSTSHFRRWREAAAACVDEQVNELGSLVLSETGGAGTEAAIVRGRDAPEVDRGGGVRTAYLATADVGAAGFMNGTTEFEPGASVQPHSHNCEESVVVLAGRGRFECEGGSSELEAGDATWVPAGASHRFVNVGPGPLRIMWTYGRVDPTRTFTHSGETIAIRPPRR